MDEEMIREIIKNAYDMHFHIGPDILPRKFNVTELMEKERGKKEKNYY